MISNTNFIFFYIICISFKLYESYVLINLKKVVDENEINKEYSPEIFINNIFDKYYSLLNVGYPPQKTEVQLSLNYFGLSMKENICLTSNYYDKSKSSTISQTHYYGIDSSSLKKVIVNESIEFPVYDTTNKILSYKSIPYYIFQYYKNDTNETRKEEHLDKQIPGKACLIYGFQFTYNRGSLVRNSLYSTLKNNDLVKYENFHYKFYTEEEKKTNGGFDTAIIIGEQPHEYDKDKYKEDYYLTTNALNMILEQGWIFEFKNYYYLSNGTKISFGLTNLAINVKGWLWLDLDIIIGIKEYFNSVQFNYFNKYPQCKTEKTVDYDIIWCDKNFDTTNFPTVYFEVFEFNYTFEMTHKELFEVRGDKKYFLIVLDNHSNYPWKFGKIFLQKYFFNFEPDKKLIGFYNNNLKSEEEEKKENENKKEGYNYWMWFLWGSIVIIVGVAGYFIGINIKKKNRKKRANELDDDEFEYKQKKEKKDYLYQENNNQNDVLGIN